MEQRRFGRTGHDSSIAIFGGFAFSSVAQEAADAAMERLIEAGVNHIDVAPTYGDAELRLGPWLAKERARFFVGCKTMERDRDGASAEMHRSLERLQIDAFDLYQLHAVTSMAELDEATGPDGALQAALDARAAGLTRFLGITSHGLDAPVILQEALSRFNFDTVLFPVNFVLYSQPDYRRNAEALLERCATEDVGVMAIKAIAKAPWDEDENQIYDTWYRPFDDQEQIEKGVNFTLSQPVTGLCTVGDITLLPYVLKACEAYSSLTEEEQETLIDRGEKYELIFS